MNWENSASVLVVDDIGNQRGWAALAIRVSHEPERRCAAMNEETEEIKHDAERQWRDVKKRWNLCVTDSEPCQNVKPHRI